VLQCLISNKKSLVDKRLHDEMKVHMQDAHLCLIQTIRDKTQINFQSFGLDCTEKDKKMDQPASDVT
jgi:hypothetical protein